MKIEELTPELAEQAQACESPEEIMGFLNDNGIELTPEQLEFISGGEEENFGEEIKTWFADLIKKIIF